MTNDQVILKQQATFLCDLFCSLRQSLLVKTRHLNPALKAIESFYLDELGKAAPGLFNDAVARQVEWQGRAINLIKG